MNYELVILEDDRERAEEAAQTILCRLGPLNIEKAEVRKHLHIHFCTNESNWDVTKRFEEAGAHIHCELKEH